MKKLGTWVGVVIFIAVIAGVAGAELSSKLALRIANGTLTACFLLLAIRAFVRPKVRIVTLVICAILALGMGYLTFNVWPSEPVYEVLGVILDFL